MRKLRFFPGPSLVEVTCKTFQSRFLLPPTPEICDVILGVLGRAQRRYGVEIHAPAFLSNHYHLLLTVRDGLQLARFMGYVNSNIAREVGRLVGWTDRFWSGRYKAVVVAHEEEAQISRLRYVLAQGTKEGLVGKPTDWPGVHAAHALLTTGKLEGTWFDRTRQYAAQRVTRKARSTDFATRETVTLTPVPCWRELEPEVFKTSIRNLLQAIETDAATERKAAGRPEPTRATLLEVSPDHRPNPIARRAAPLIHAATRALRVGFLEAYRAFDAAFRDASLRFRSGERTVSFPDGCFAPALGWIPVALETA